MSHSSDRHRHDIHGWQRWSLHNGNRADSVPSLVIVFNPVAGRRRTSLLWRVLDVLVANGVRLEVVETRCAGHAASLARDAAARGEPMVVAAGGDGTIAEVASGLLGTGARLGVIPLGTANVLAHELALPFDPRAVAAALAFGRTRMVWPGLARSAGGTRLFVQMLGVGFDAQVVHRLSIPMKRAFGRGAYVIQTVVEALFYRSGPIVVRVDGVEREAASLIITKGRFYAGPYLLAREADPTEPGFSVVLFRRGGTGPALLYGAMLPLDLLWRAPWVHHLRARHIDIPGSAAVPVHADGDPAGCTPQTVTDAPGPIAIVIGG